jgi:hypothetical protein
VIHSAPEVMHLTIDPHKHLVKMPPPLGIAAAINTPPSDLRGKHRTERAPRPYWFGNSGIPRKTRKEGETTGLPGPYERHSVVTATAMAKTSFSRLKTGV